MRAIEERRESEWRFHWCVPLRLFVSLVYITNIDIYIFCMGLRFNSCLSLWKSPLLAKFLSFSNSSSYAYLNGAREGGYVSRYKPHQTTHHTIVFDGWGLSHSQIVNVWGLFCIIFSLLFWCGRWEERKKKKTWWMDVLIMILKKRQAKWVRSSKNVLLLLYSFIRWAACKTFYSNGKCTKQKKLNKICSVMRSVNICMQKWLFLSNCESRLFLRSACFCSSARCCCCNWFLMQRALLQA